MLSCRPFAFLEDNTFNWHILKLTWFGMGGEQDYVFLGVLFIFKKYLIYF